MASTIAHRALEINKNRATRQLYNYLHGPDSFALDQATRLPAEWRSAAITIADSPWPLNTNADATTALIQSGYRASAFARYLDGIRAYAANRRSMS
jgi:hypothetical protein